MVGVDVGLMVSKLITGQESKNKNMKQKLRILNNINCRFFKSAPMPIIGRINVIKPY